MTDSGGRDPGDSTVPAAPSEGARAPLRQVAVLEVLAVCGIPTQAALTALLVLVRLPMTDEHGLSLTFFATLSFLDTVLVLWLIRNPRTTAEQNTRAALERVNLERANAEARIAQARGQAESNRLLAESIRSNPEVVRLREIERTLGLCPLNASTCVIGQGVNLSQLIENRDAQANPQR